MTSANKKEIFKNSAKYISSQYVAQVIGFVISIAMRRFLGPAMMGVWSLLQVVLSYLSYANLGTQEVAYRDIPYYKGAGQLDKAEDLKNQVFTMILFGSVLASLVLGGYLYVQWGRLDPYLVIGMVFLAIINIPQRFYEYSTTLLRANSQFNVIGLLTVASSLFNCVLIFLLVKPFKLYGLLAATFCVTLFGIIFIRVGAPQRFKLAFSMDSWIKILKIGVPLFVSGFCTMTLISVDKIFIAKYLGLEALGNYSIASMAGNYLLGVPNMFAIAIYPKLQEKYGQSQSVEGIKNYLLQPILIVAVMMSILIGFACITIPPLVYFFLPKFLGGIAAMRIFIWSAFFFAIAQHASLFVVTLNKQMRLIVISLFGIGGVLGFSFLFVRMGMGLSGVALAVVVGSALYATVLISYAKSHFASALASARFFGVIYFCLAYFAALSFSLAAWGSDRDLIMLMIRVSIYLIGALPFLWYLNKKTKVLSVCRAIIFEKLINKPRVL